MPFRTQAAQNEYHRRYYLKTITDIREAFGNKCQKCGWDKVPAVLEFAHRRDQIKVKAIAQAIRGQRKVLNAELKKCMLLCPTCHRIYDLETRNTMAVLGISEPSSL